MKSILAACFLLFAAPAIGQVLWFEDFEDDANGAQTGTAVGTIGGGWTATHPGPGTFSKQDPTGSNIFLVNSNMTLGEWKMNAPISIAGTGRAMIEVTVVGFLVGASDTFTAFYRLDGGPEIPFFQQTGNIVSLSLAGSAIVTGSNVEVIIRAVTDGSVFGIDSFTFDDVRITAINTLYSRKSGNWNDVTAGNGTWSAIALGGVSCDCQPITTDYVIVGAGHTVDINVAATAGGVEVQNASSLRYTVDAVDLNIDRGILQVNVGGTINRNARTGVGIDFDRGLINSFTNNGTVTTENIEVTANIASLNITGNGSINITGDFGILANDNPVTHSLAGVFTIGDDLIFSGDDGTFTNNQTLTVTSDIFVETAGDDGNTFTNPVGAVLNVGGMNFTDSNTDILNSGTINQSGDFVGIVAAANIDNLATGVWNWNFLVTVFDAQLVSAMTSNAVGSIFNYSGAGNQSILGITYHHLTLSNSGVKATTAATLDINGNLLISGTAQLDADTGDDNVTLAGNWTVTSTNVDPFDGDGRIVTLDGTLNTQTISTVLAGGETFDNLVTNNTFAAPPQITLSSNVSVAAILNMTSGRINLNGRTFTITSSAAGALVHGLTSASGWMYGGTIVRGTTNVAIAVGNVRGFFPMGIATDFRPFYIGKPATTAGTTTLVYDGTSTTTNTVSIADDLTITRRHNSFWTVSTTCTTGTNTWAIRAGGTGFGTIANITHLRLPTGGPTVVGAPGVNSGTAANPLVERLNLSIANINPNNFHIGSVDNVNSPLPIELINFTATPEGGKVRVDWSTATELNNDFFTLERTADAEGFEQLATIKGKGTTTNTSTYQHYDNAPLLGTSYYRLKQTDLDGTFSYSALVKVVVDSKPVLSASPNPVTEKKALVRISGLLPEEEVMIVITDMRGTTAFTSRRISDLTGVISIDADLASAAPGLYLVRVLSANALAPVKLVIE